MKTCKKEIMYQKEFLPECMFQTYKSRYCFTVAASSEWPIIANMEKVKRENNVGVVAQK